MGERFVVVPVAGEREHANAVVAEPARGTGGGGGDAAEESEPWEDPVFEPQHLPTTVPILEYNREPNKYGKSRTPHGGLGSRDMAKSELEEESMNLSVVTKRVIDANEELQDCFVGGHGV
ncbi:hypothetical protein Q5P01_003190 [Channa striata]|uniref:Uncharacterized protein n=1 Tax=Channa striata TaxID=64152 RepID=A0AA88T2J7_CHASR|nr:hypothetical protein Q5P01_003190 [Channa striata]